MSDRSRGTFEGWAILELMGHRRLAGYVTEVEVAGAGMLRLDVSVDDEPVATQFYSTAAVYCLTPTTEEIARAIAVKPTPVHAFELPRSVQEEEPWDDREPIEDADLTGGN